MILINFAKISQKIKINNDYTCYDSDLKLLQIAVDVGEIDLDSLIIHVSNKQDTKSFEMTKIPSSYAGVTMYAGDPSLIMPEKNSGKTYFFSLETIGLTSLAEVRIAPKTKGYLCPTSEALIDFRAC